MNKTEQCNQTNLIKFINSSRELKEQMKENFYEQKIIEAKTNKGINFNNFWDILPYEVEQHILRFKEEIELKDYKGYIPRMIKEHHLTHKSCKDYIFKKYKNEEDEGIKSCPAINHNFEKFLLIMINKKKFVEDYYSIKKGSKSYPQISKDWDRITKNKSPSLEEFIEFRKEEKKIASKKLKENNKKKAKSEDDKCEWKVGDLVCQGGRYGGHNVKVYRITGETNTQLRVEAIEWTETKWEQINQGQTDDYYHLTSDESEWKISKSKNIGKKQYLYLLDKNHYSRKYDNYNYNTNDYLIIDQRFFD
tara:strand:+ start:44 stop:961 length:918 start_codon:yes stop_codon:yes gene_type:complete